jgi:hypothetical protein
MDITQKYYALQSQYDIGLEFIAKLFNFEIKDRIMLIIDNCLKISIYYEHAPNRNKGLISIKLICNDTSLTHSYLKYDSLCSNIIMQKYGERLVCDY